MAASTRVTRSASATVAVAPSARPAKTQSSRTPTKPPRKAPASKKREADAELEESLHGRPNPVTMGPPQTPPAKRARKGAQKSSPDESEPPATPTPSAAREFATNGIVNGSNHRGIELPISRPADPAATNAPLATPRGTRHTAYQLGEAPPSYLPPPRADTMNLLEKACSHLCHVDPRMKKIIDTQPCTLFSPEALAEPVDPFKSLVSGIVSQQVSGAAAASILRKFVALFNSPDADVAEHVFPSPTNVVTKDIPALRTAGLSQRKAEYINGLAQKFVDGELGAEILVKSSWEEVLEKLTAVRGLGVWSVEMFGLFALKRMDIFSTGDLGVQRGLAAFIGKDVKKLKAKGGGKWKYCSEKEMMEHSAKFAPYRSLFMWYMWRVEDVNVDAMQAV